MATIVPMTGNDKIRAADLETLKVIHYPDPRLREVCTPIEDPTDPAVAALVDRMFELMFARQGVGLAAPQVGITARLFIGSPSFEPADRRVYINPEMVSVDGWQEGEEGCLSFPDIHCKIRRYKQAVLRAYDLEGNCFEETGVDLTARLFQHEGDHLDGRLLVDRMSKLAKMAHRRQLNELESQFT